MRIEEWMTPSPISVAPGAPVAEIGALPVVEGDAVVGILAEIDLLRAFAQVLAAEPVAA